MPEMFRQFMVTLRSEQVAQLDVATPSASKAPIDKLAQYRAYTFTGRDDDNPEAGKVKKDNTLSVVIAIENTSRPMQKNGACFYCGEQGHFIRDWPMNSSKTQNASILPSSPAQSSRGRGPRHATSGASGRPQSSMGASN
ncbi:hypothetical protein V6N12_057309 [Hibiscus sabdariffa]|uniref:CCHC-type domain-containing protein n=1 Tax=Hibiscus sabdariffa TaxID=183260 RepID=A0ABR2DCE5_9ROSI